MRNPSHIQQTHDSVGRPYGRLVTLYVADEAEVARLALGVLGYARMLAQVWIEGCEHAGLDPVPVRCFCVETMLRRVIATQRDNARTALANPQVQRQWVGVPEHVPADLLSYMLPSVLAVFDRQGFDEYGTIAVEREIGARVGLDFCASVRDGFAHVASLAVPEHMHDSPAFASFAAHALACREPWPPTIRVSLVSARPAGAES